MSTSSYNNEYRRREDFYSDLIEGILVGTIIISSIVGMGYVYGKCKESFHREEPKRTYCFRNNLEDYFSSSKQNLYK